MVEQITTGYNYNAVESTSANNFTNVNKKNKKATRKLILVANLKTILHLKLTRH